MMLTNRRIAGRLIEVGVAEASPPESAGRNSENVEVADLSVYAFMYVQVYNTISSWPDRRSSFLFFNNNWLIRLPVTLGSFFLSNDHS